MGPDAKIVRHLPQHFVVLPGAADHQLDLTTSRATSLNHRGELNGLGARADHDQGAKVGHCRTDSSTKPGRLAWTARTSLRAPCGTAAGKRRTPNSPRCRAVACWQRGTT